MILVHKKEASVKYRSPPGFICELGVNFYVEALCSIGSRGYFSYLPRAQVTCVTADSNMFLEDDC